MLSAEKSARKTQSLLEARDSSSLPYPEDSWSKNFYTGIQNEHDFTDLLAHPNDFLMIGDPRVSLKDIPDNTLYHLTTTGILTADGAQDVLPYHAFKSYIEYLASTGNVKAEVLNLIGIAEQTLVGQSDSSFKSYLGQYHSAVFAGVNVSMNLLDSLRKEQALRPENMIRMTVAVGILTKIFHSRASQPMFDHGTNREIAQDQSIGSYIAAITNTPERMFTFATSELEKLEPSELVRQSLATIGITGAWEIAIQKNLGQISPEESLQTAEQLAKITKGILKSMDRPTTFSAVKKIPIVLEYSASSIVPSTRAGDRYLLYSTGRPPSIAMAPRLPNSGLKAIRVHQDDLLEADSVFATMAQSAVWENHTWKIKKTNSWDYVPVLALDESVPTIDHCMKRYNDELSQFNYVLEHLTRGDFTFIQNDRKNSRLHTLLQYAESLQRTLSLQEKIALKRSLF